MPTGKIYTIIRSWILPAILLSFPVQLLPQGYTLKNYTTENGLPHNNVREIVRDKSGYLWMATWDGLSRYDGYEFRNYQHMPGDSTSIPFFSIGRIVLDASNNFWLQTDNGQIARFNRKLDNFSTITQINGEKLPVARSISGDEKGNIWIITDTVMFRYDPVTDRFTRYSVLFPDGRGSIATGSILNLKAEDERTMWLAGPVTYRMELNGSRRIIEVKNIITVNLKPVPQEKMILNYDHSTWYKLYIDKTGKKWLLSDLGLFLVDEEAGTANEFTGNIPLNDFEGSELILWGSMEGGLSIYNPVSRFFLKLPPEAVQFFKFGCQQGSELIWYSNTSFTGTSLGLTRLILTPDYFKKYTDRTKDDAQPAVFSVSVDNKKNVWLGIRGRNYISIITPDNKLIKKYTEASSKPGFFGPIRSIKRTPNGLWIGYFDNLLLFYDYKTESFSRYNPGRYLYRALEVREDGKLYIGNDELIIYDPVTGKKELICDSIPAGGNFRFRTDSEGQLWSGIPYGMVLNYNPSENKVSIYQTSNKSNNIEDVCPGDSGDIWLAVLGGGLVRYNTVSMISKVYTTSDGLSNNTVYSILRDRHGNIWASTNNGLSRLNPLTGIIKSFGIAEGLDIMEFNSGASFIDDDGRFFFGGMGGAVGFYPDSIYIRQNDLADSKIILTRLTISGQARILNKTLNGSDTITLEKGEDNFHFTIAISDFTVSEKTIYRYRLYDHDKKWITTDHYNRNINYDNLKPGKYILSIQATDRDGEWTIDRNLKIILRPFLYQTLYFKILSICFIAFLLLGMVILYIRQLKQKAIQVQDGLRLQSLRGQMNPHFIFNSLNSINYFISNNDKISANRYISDFARLIRSILSNMGSDYVSFEGEMNSIKDYLEIEHLRFGDKFDYKLDYSNIEDPDILEIFPGLIQPFIENAIWHGVRALERRKGRIRIIISGSDNQKMKCVIEDDGIGRKKSAELRKNNENHESRGIAIVTERLHIISKLRNINYCLEVSDLSPEREDTGTRIVIDIPVRLIR